MRPLPSPCRMLHQLILRLGALRSSQADVRLLAVQLLALAPSHAPRRWPSKLKSPRREPTTHARRRQLLQTMQNFAHHPRRQRRCRWAGRQARTRCRNPCHPEFRRFVLQSAHRLLSHPRKALRGSRTACPCSTRWSTARSSSQQVIRQALQPDGAASADGNTASGVATPGGHKLRAVDGALLYLGRKDLQSVPKDVANAVSAQIPVLRD